MSFSTVGEFFAMGGHGLYVWLSYAAALIIVLYNVVSVRLRLRRFFRDAWDRDRRSAAHGETPGGTVAAAAGDSNCP